MRRLSFRSPRHGSLSRGPSSHAVSSALPSPTSCSFTCSFIYFFHSFSDSANKSVPNPTGTGVLGPWKGQGWPFSPKPDFRGSIRPLAGFSWPVPCAGDTAGHPHPHPVALEVDITVNLSAQLRACQGSPVAERTRGERDGGVAAVVGCQRRASDAVTSRPREPKVQSLQGTRPEPGQRGTPGTGPCVTHVRPAQDRTGEETPADGRGLRQGPSGEAGVPGPATCSGGGERWPDVTRACTSSPQGLLTDWTGDSRGKATPDVTSGVWP